MMTEEIKDTELETSSNYIHIYKDYYFTVDSRQYSLYKKTDRVDKKTGKTVFASQGCYDAKLSTVLNKVIILEQSGFTVDNYVEFQRKTEQLIKELKEAVDNANRVGD